MCKRADGCWWVTYDWYLLGMELSQDEGCVDKMSGNLYIVATPIGNLQDISLRALETLKQVDLIATEDTRHAQRLLNHFQIKQPLLSLHAHNEQQQSLLLLDKLKAKQNIALITDAGTPLVSDPGLLLVRLARAQEIRVVPIPGACALIAALSAAGMATDRFTFEGFLPAKPIARKKSLAALVLEARTMVFYEAPHRILASIQAMQEIFGANREVVLARELTKHYETIKGATLAEMAEWIEQDQHQQQGEMVVIVSGCKVDDSATEDLQAQLQEVQRILTILRQELPLTQAASLAAKITGLSKKEVYALGVKIDFK